VIEGRYFNNLTYNFKKGIGHVFFMRSRDFVPLITFYDEIKQHSFGVQEEIYQNGVWTVSIEFTPEKDSTLIILLSSKVAGDTGYFHYGFIALPPEQLNFNRKLTTCERLKYLFNHWEAKWRLTGKTVDVDSTNKGKVRVTDSEYNTRTLTDKGFGTVTPGGYAELIYSEEEGLSVSSIDKKQLKNHNTDTLQGIDLYEKLIQQISICLGSAVWLRETEKTDTGKMTTYFFPTGIKRQDWESVFKIEYTKNVVTGMTEIRLFLY
jgi:hypothetical protein